MNNSLENLFADMDQFLKEDFEKDIMINSTAGYWSDDSREVAINLILRSDWADDFTSECMIPFIAKRDLDTEYKLLSNYFINLDDCYLAKWEESFSAILNQENTGTRFPKEGVYASVSIEDLARRPTDDCISWLDAAVAKLSVNFLHLCYENEHEHAVDFYHSYSKGA